MSAATAVPVRARSDDRPIRTMRPSILRRFARNRAAIFGAAILAALAAAAVGAPWLAPYDIAVQDFSSSLQGPSPSHLLGTDEFGRDVFSRILHGARISLPIAMVAVAGAVLIGGAFGALAGYVGGRADTLISRVADVLLAFPELLLAIAISAAMGAGLVPVAIAIGFVRIPAYIRLTRAAVLAVNGEPYVEAARSVGAGYSRTLLRHVLPNCLAPMIVQGSVSMATALLQMSALSFLGLGAQPPTPEWGSMLSTSRSFLRVAPHLVTFPGVAIVLAVLGFNLVGDGLRDALDVRGLDRRIAPSQT